MSETVYRCSELLDRCEQEIAHTTSDYQMLEHRIEVLEYLLNCGIEFTTISQLNSIK